jgi:hypothetical protein
MKPLMYKCNNQEKQKISYKPVLVSYKFKETSLVFINPSK